MKWVGFPDGVSLTHDELADWFDRLEQNDRRFHFVVLDGSSVCGEAFYRIDDPSTTAGLDIKLLPEARGRGLATAALNALIAEVRRSSPMVREVWTEPSLSNEAAMRLYARCGLAPRERPGHLPRGDTYWALTLSR